MITVTIVTTIARSACRSFPGGLRRRAVLRGILYLITRTGTVSHCGEVAGPFGRLAKTADRLRVALSRRLTVIGRSRREPIRRVAGSQVRRYRWQLESKRNLTQLCAT